MRSAFFRSSRCFIGKIALSLVRGAFCGSFGRRYIAQNRALAAARRFLGDFKALLHSKNCALACAWFLFCVFEAMHHGINCALAPAWCICSYSLTMHHHKKCAVAPARCIFAVSSRCITTLKPSCRYLGPSWGYLGAILEPS